jgi:hypothetical protein
MRDALDTNQVTEGTHVDLCRKVYLRDQFLPDAHKCGVSLVSSACPHDISALILVDEALVHEYPRLYSRGSEFLRNENTRDVVPKAQS